MTTGLVRQATIPRPSQPGGGPSDGQLIVNVQGATTIIARTGLVTQHVWKAATIDWPRKVVTPLQQDDIDCTSSWSNGCTLPIP